jgi:hypothetical protein
LETKVYGRGVAERAGEFEFGPAFRIALLFGSINIVRMNPMNDAQLTQLVSVFVGQLPVLIISLLGCVVIMARKNELGAAWSWALMGFGLSILLCVLIPLGQTLVQKWALDGGVSMTQRASVYTMLALVWSILRAVSFGLLLMAIVTGRGQRSAV